MSTQPVASGAGASGYGHLLEFEKPIVKMEQEIQRLEAIQVSSGRDCSEIISSIRAQLQAAVTNTFSNLTPWENVQVARHPKRPLLRDYIRMLCVDFCELHGDKLFGDDHALVTGFARLAGHKVMLVGHQKGRDTHERRDCNFGCAHPEGYRKALQKMKLAAKFGVPVVCLIDTPGAYPGIGAEERGIAAAIATNLMELSRLPTPIVACVIGEGGSGGALGIAVADQVAVMRHAYYSVISPEGGAAILWKSSEHAARAAGALKMTPPDLLKLKLIDAVVDEPVGGAHRDPLTAARNLEAWIGTSLREMTRLKTDTLLRRRAQRLRDLGSFFQTTERRVAAAAGAGKPTKRRKASGDPTLANSVVS